MDYVVFIPGTMGSVLKTPGGDPVWPPTVAETQFGYRRINDLLRPDLVVGDIVQAVACFGVYRPMVQELTDIGYLAAGPKRQVLFPYDWRQDLEQTADLLAARLTELVAGGAATITLVAHSMGGLVARLVLESGKFDAAPWFGHIKALITIGTPHLGAPLALARVLGLDSAMGISGADFRRIAGDRRYPSGYQLLPAPGEAACWDIATPDLRPIEIYAAAAAARLGLDPVLLARARFVHDTLRDGAPPAGVRYFFFAGTGHKTATRVNIGTTTRVVTRSDDAGDGTVPLWSALPGPGQKQTVVGEHMTFFTAQNFKAVFYRLLGATFSAPPTGLTPVMQLSVQAIILGLADEIELVLAPPRPLAAIAGTFTLERTDAEGAPFVPFGAPVPLAYAGPPVPLLKLHLPPPGRSGIYRISFAGPDGSAEPVLFSVTEG